MKEIERVPFSHNGQKYEVVVALDEMRLKAKAMLNGKAANNVTASADIDTAMDLTSEHGADVVEMLVQQAKDSVINKPLTL
jgi:hypothetical protein